MTINVHGLPRTIPSDIKRKVRQRCGFGCVLCGNAVCQYEHVDPPFADAVMHDPDKIALLCGGCHDRVTRGLVSKDTVSRHLDNPKSVNAGQSREWFDITASYPTIEFCGTRFLNIRTVIAMMGMEILSIHSPECAGAPMRISGLFCDAHGSEILRIVNNEWFSNASNWDVEVQGRRIIVRRAPNDIALIIRAEPPNTIAIEQIAMYYKGARVVGREGGQIDAVAPSGSKVCMIVKTVTGSGNGTGLFVDNDRVLFGCSQNFQVLKAQYGAT